MLGNMRRGRAFSLDAEVKMMDDLIDDLVVLDEGDDLHRACARRIDERINFIDFLYHLRPAL